MLDHTLLTSWIRTNSLSRLCRWFICTLNEKHLTSRQYTSTKHIIPFYSSFKLFYPSIYLVAQFRNLGLFFDHTLSHSSSLLSLSNPSLYYSTFLHYRQTTYEEKGVCLAYSFGDWKSKEPGAGSGKGPMTDAECLQEESSHLKQVAGGDSRVRLRLL